MKKQQEMLQIALKSESHLAWRELMRSLSRFQQKLLVTLNDKDPLSLGISVDYLARYTFSTNQTVSSALGKLRGLGLIEYRKNPVDTRNHEYWIKYVGMIRCLNGYGLKC